MPLSYYNFEVFAILIHTLNLKQTAFSSVPLLFGSVGGVVRWQHRFGQAREARLRGLGRARPEVVAGALLWLEGLHLLASKRVRERRCKKRKKRKKEKTI